ncbi:TPA: 2-oxo acid dehydrogenase subunit E2 [Escherichia albertii]|uniref:Dihydrolipoamide acetyltransferase component of pyruvate dehydrogenase complex n=1 Tax=Escherichia albertii TaxID=208962 RepID=A0ABD7E8D5_ESCAL|nr:2-oxo acid dehydrogenase subunit E2 [Escherichia albertii]QST73290.1 2-oxo acid dehydrogenase subunit E2 [Escherichia albertii]HEB1298662.1 2-oxo acid dehydrogenase subunit E2 [Escherichia albertii]HEB1364236.1 2-oxo acid dehydrogenase subunit E2 [Escherichia albertii]
MIEITVPVLPESVTEGTLSAWCKQEGEHVKRDEVIAELETDKVILEIPAPQDGVLSNIIVSEGSTVTSAQLLAHLKPQAAKEETVSSNRGLVVPVLRNAQSLSLVEIERQIAEYATLARSGKLPLEALQGGTFSITNGGTFGSMMSTPIINPPQSAILGMHAITPRPVAENGQVVIRPMMYLALSYDHRIIDGQEAVQTLVAIRELLESPEQLLLDL